MKKLSESSELIDTVEDAAYAVAAVGQMIRTAQVARERVSGSGFDYIGGSTIEGLGFAVEIISNKIGLDCDRLKSLLNAEISKKIDSTNEVTS